MLSMPTEPIDVRWRLADGGLPMRERHLRSLASMGVGAPMQSWIRTRLEWTLDNMVAETPDGVLCIDVQDDEMVTITVVGCFPRASVFLILNTVLLTLIRQPSKSTSDHFRAQISPIRIPV